MIEAIFSVHDLVLFVIGIIAAIVATWPDDDLWPFDPM